MEAESGLKGSVRLQKPPSPAETSQPCRTALSASSTWPAGLDQAGRRELLESQSPGKPSFRDKWHRSLVTETHHFSSGLEESLAEFTCWTLSANDARPGVGQKTK